MKIDGRIHAATPVPCCAVSPNIADVSCLMLHALPEGLRSILGTFLSHRASLSSLPTEVLHVVMQHIDASESRLAFALALLPDSLDRYIRPPAELAAFVGIALLESAMQTVQRDLRRFADTVLYRTSMQIYSPTYAFINWSAFGSRVVMPCAHIWWSPNPPHARVDVWPRIIRAEVLRAFSANIFAIRVTAHMYSMSHLFGRCRQFSNVCVNLTPHRIMSNPVASHQILLVPDDGRSPLLTPRLIRKWIGETTSRTEILRGL